MDKQQERIGSSATLINDRRGDLMVESEAVSAMLRLKGLSAPATPQLPRSVTSASKCLIRLALSDQSTPRVRVR